MNSSLEQGSIAQTSTARVLFLDGAPEEKAFADGLADQLKARGFTVRRSFEPGVAQSSAAIAVMSSPSSPWIDNELRRIREAHFPLLIVATQAFELPSCLAAYRCPPDAGKRLDAALRWLEQVLSRPQLPLAIGESAPASAFWSRRLALASEDLQRAVRSVLALTVGGRFHSAAVAIAPSLVVAPIEELPAGAVLRLASGDLPVEQVGLARGVTVLKVPVKLTDFLPLSAGNPASPLIAALSIDAAQKVSLCPGWLTAVPTASELMHDAINTMPGAALVSLETGDLLGIATSSGGALPAALVHDLLPAGSVPAAVAGLESAADDALEAVKARPEDYADRNGYDPKFLGVPVPLPKTSRQVELLPYANFTVALSGERRLTVYAVVNINGKNLVDKHRAGDPWQLDPRVPDDHQVGGKYYAGTPLDRGHMVRRVDPVWGQNADQAERDTFHYPNSCPQHKNLNRKTWNDLEDYIYANLQRDDMKVTVFTGPVLAGDDAPFHGVQLPKEFWKIVVIRKDDGDLSATAYLLSQEDMIEGLEFVYGEFRTYQVAVALIEKKTGLDFGNLHSFDPRAKKSGLEAVERPVSEIRGPQDLDLDFSAGVVKIAVPPAATPAPEVQGDIWANPAEGEQRLNAALDTFDWTASEQLNNGLITALARNPGKFDEVFARRVLYHLQRKRRFNAIIRVGDAFLQQGLSNRQIRQRYAQALIDQGFYFAAELLLNATVADVSAPHFEQEEAQGLLGRISKQVYVNADAPDNPANAAHLQRAVNFYWASYAQNPIENYWHGINVVACLKRAASDGVKLQAPADPQMVAADILKNLQDREARSTTGELKPFELATFVEVHVALGQFSEALTRARMYADCKDADAFEIASTLRQLEEVWRLRTSQPADNAILSIIRAALLERQGGSLQLSADAVRENLQSQPALEKVFGFTKSLSLQWYESGLQRAKSIARIETNGKGFGTGWLVNAGDFFPGRSGFLLVTNAHVIGPNTPDRYPEALRPEDVTVHFQIQNWKMATGKVAFHSPVHQHDATFLELPDLPAGAEALPIDPSILNVDKPPQRLYIIGHPGGRDLEFALQDNYLLAATGQLVHYRTPSEGGSSGSPVFGPTDWKVVALHHAGRKDMPRLDGQPGTYEANEGIALAALQEATSSTVRVAAG